MNEETNKRVLIRFALVSTSENNLPPEPDIDELHILAQTRVDPAGLDDPSRLLAGYEHGVAITCEDGYRSYGRSGSIFYDAGLGAEYDPYYKFDTVELGYSTGNRMLARQFGPRMVSLTFSDACKNVVLTESVGPQVLHQARYIFKGFHPEG